MSADYDSLCSQRDSVRAEINTRNARVEDYNYLLRRLKPAKTTVSNLKSTFRTDVRNKDENLVDAKYSWAGDRYESFLRNEAGEVTGFNDYYYNYCIDHVLDSLNDEITRIENLILKEKGILGKLGAKLNSLLNEIENFFN